MFSTDFPRVQIVKCLFVRKEFIHKAQDNEIVALSLPTTFVAQLVLKTNKCIFGRRSWHCPFPKGFPKHFDPSLHHKFHYLLMVSNFDGWGQTRLQSRTRKLARSHCSFWNHQNSWHRSCSCFHMDPKQSPRESLDRNRGKQSMF